MPGYAARLSRLVHIKGWLIWLVVLVFLFYFFNFIIFFFLTAIKQAVSIILQWLTDISSYAYLSDRFSQTSQDILSCCDTFTFHINGNSKPSCFIIIFKYYNKLLYVDITITCQQTDNSRLYHYFSRNRNSSTNHLVSLFETSKSWVNNSKKHGISAIIWTHLPVQVFVQTA